MEKTRSRQIGFRAKSAKSRETNADFFPFPFWVFWEAEEEEEDGPLMGSDKTGGKGGKGRKKDKLQNGVEQKKRKTRRIRPFCAFYASLLFRKSGDDGAKIRKRRMKATFCARSEMRRDCFFCVFALLLHP